MPNNLLILGDTQYELDKAYRDGAMAMRRRIPYNCNPHRDGSQKHDQWDYGHVNESAGSHVLNGVDVIVDPPSGRIFEDRT